MLALLVELMKFMEVYAFLCMIAICGFTLSECSCHRVGTRGTVVRTVVMAALIKRQGFAIASCRSCASLLASPPPRTFHHPQYVISSFQEKACPECQPVSYSLGLNSGISACIISVYRIRRCSFVSPIQSARLFQRHASQHPISPCFSLFFYARHPIR
jgi:hypothetical protein